MAAQRHPSPWLDWITICVFAALLSLPTLGALVFDREWNLLRERRMPASRPELSADPAALRAFPEAFEAWFGDRFALRNELVRAYNAVLLLGLGVSPSSAVLRGENGWLFDGRESFVASYRRTAPFSTGELEAWRRHVEAKRDWFEERGVGYLFVIAPSKSTIYPEHMPAYASPAGDESRHDELLRYLGERSTVRVLDLRPALLRAKERTAEPIYFPLGNHWNELGAFEAVQAIVRELQDLLPSLAPEPLRAYRIENRPRRAVDNWYVQLYLEGPHVQPYPFLRPADGRKPHPRNVGGVRRYVGVNPHGGRLLLIGDSFSYWLGPFLARQARDLAVCNHNAPELVPRWVDEVQPQVAIDEHYENGLMREPPALEGWLE